MPHAALCIVAHNDLWRVAHPVTRIDESPDEVNIFASGEILIAAINCTECRCSAYENSCWYVGHTASGPNWTWQMPHVERARAGPVWCTYIVAYPWCHDVSAGVDIGDASRKPVRVDSRHNIGIDKSDDVGADRRQSGVSGSPRAAPVRAPNVGVFDGRGGMVVDDKAANAMWHLGSVHRRTKGRYDDGDPIIQGYSGGVSVVSNRVADAGIEKASDEWSWHTRATECGSNAFTASWCYPVDRQRRPTDDPIANDVGGWVHLHPDGGCSRG